MKYTHMKKDWYISLNTPDKNNGFRECSPCFFHLAVRMSHGNLSIAVFLFSPVEATLIDEQQ